MNKQTKLIISIIVCIVLFIGAILLYNNLKEKPVENHSAEQSSSQITNNNIQSTTKPSYILQDITIYDENKNPINLSDFRGKKVILNLWATWCGYCIKEMPDFEKAYNTNKDDIVFIMLNVEGTGDSSIPTSQKFIADKGYTFPIYYDLKNESNKYMNLTRGGIPATFFIDENGNLVAMQPGAMTGEMLQKGINMLMEE